MRTEAWRIDYTEYECGWGSRSEGYSLFATQELAKDSYKKHWDRYPDGEAPNYYIHASQPRKVELTVKEATVMGDNSYAAFP